MTTEAKYRIFMAEFMKDYSPGKAYQRCPFWKATGAAASVNGSKILRREDVQSWIREAMERRQQRFEAEQEARHEEQMAAVRQKMFGA